MNEISIDPYLLVRTVKCIFFHTKSSRAFLLYCLFVVRFTMININLFIV